MTNSKEIPDVIYRIAAAATVMSGENFTSQNQSEPVVNVRLKLKKEIYDFMKAEGLDINVVVNRLLENFVVAYKSFWEGFSQEIGSPGRIRTGVAGSRVRQD